MLALAVASGGAYLTMRSGLFTAPASADLTPRSVAASARLDGEIAVPGEATTLQMAIDACQPGDTIRLAPGTYPGGVRIAGRAVRLVGAGAGKTLLQGGSAGPVLAIEAPQIGEVSVSGLTIQGAPGANEPGVIIGSGRAELRDVTLRGNSGSGAVIHEGARVTMADCAFIDNRSGMAGGGVRNKGGAVLLVDCAFNGNIAVTFGGAIYSDGGSVDVVACSFDGNSTTSGAFGGAVYGSRAALRVLGTDFVRNESREAGGALYMQQGSAAIDRCSFTGNLAEGAWAVYSDGGSVRLAGSRLCGDAAQLLGGDLSQSGGNFFDNACFPDCNQNGVSDADEIARGWAQDLDSNGTPDDCDADCNSNGLPDSYELASGFAQDANRNGIIDTCEIRMGLVPDQDHDLIPDDVQNDALRDRGADRSPARAPSRFDRILR